MRNYAQKSKKNFVVADFVCPLPEQFKIFKPNFIMDGYNKKVTKYE